MFQNRQNQIFWSKSGSQYFPEKCITDLPQCEKRTERSAAVGKGAEKESGENWKVSVTACH